MGLLLYLKFPSVSCQDPFSHRGISFQTPSTKAHLPDLVGKTGHAV